MNIGKVTIGSGGAVSFDGVHIGHIANLIVEQDIYGRHGSVSIVPVDNSLDMVAIAKDLAESNLCVTFDFKQSFWANSFAKDGEWHIELPASTATGTEVIPLGIKKTSSPGPDLSDPEDLMLGIY